MTRTILKAALCIAALTGAAQVAAAQSSGSADATMQALLRDGFEIKAMAPNGSQYVVLLQKDKAAYACEFVTVTNSRCRAINSESE
ncbi:hypothetical protein [Hoeflea poritis]|uniref:Uncharacterized protein n=1 Tax=Hoeflea poritis TaxID=2993659 RepID=A0ABT4VQ23_9HYPH|nr:hypothetical protein [Hoeflea poritis]MDA4846808.1 hypothetical protein [Hoeflea poritis]